MASMLPGSSCKSATRIRLVILVGPICGELEAFFVCYFVFSTVFKLHFKKSIKEVICG